MGAVGTESRRSNGRGPAGRPGEASVGELSIGLFALSLIAFSPPLLVMFGAPRLLFGIPLLYVYLFVAWCLVIALLARLAKRAERTLTDEREPPSPSPDPAEES